EPDLVGDADDAGPGAELRVQPQRALAARHDQADVAVDDLVGLDALALDLDHFLARNRDRQSDLPGALPQPVHVLAQLEDAPAIDADALEHTVPVEQAVVVDADGRLAPGNHLPVDVDDG